MVHSAIDIILLSYTKSSKEYEMTKDCIFSLHNNLNVKAHITLVETNPQIRHGTYDVENFITPCQDFNYNKFLNIGLKFATHEKVLISNNDIHYKSNCLQTLAEKLEIYSSVSPLDLASQSDLMNKDDIVGYEIGKLLTGWSIMFNRSILDQIGMFDERFNFWYQDNDYSNWLQKCNLKHALIPSAHIIHAGQQSLQLLTSEEIYQQTHGLSKIFEDKWKNWDKVERIQNI